MENKILETKNLNVFFESHHILKDISLHFYREKATAIMGPSGCGKTTLIRCINRMHDVNRSVEMTGSILFNGRDIFQMDTTYLRRQIGMVFQKPYPFPTMSIAENVLAGYILNGIKKTKLEKEQIVTESLKKVSLWEEVKDSLNKKGTLLSGGQQQRLCIARSLAMKTEIVLLDEPTSALDPKSTASIEELIRELKKSMTIIIVTHNMSQAARVTDYTAFLYEGRFVEFGETEKVFTVPKNKKTEDYLSGRFG